MQPNAELLKYIQEQTGQGWSIDQILPELHSFGWPDEEIKAALAWLSKPTLIASEQGASALTQIPASVNEDFFAQPVMPPPANNTAQSMGGTVPGAIQAPHQPAVLTPQLENNGFLRALPTQPAPSASAPDSAQTGYATMSLPVTQPAMIVPEVVQPAVMPPPNTSPDQAMPASQVQQLQPTLMHAPQSGQSLPNPLSTQQLTMSTPLAIDQQTMLPTQRKTALPLSLMKRFKRQLSVVFIAIAITTAGLLLWSVMNETPQGTYKKSVEKSLLTSTYQREYITSSLSEGLQIHATIKSDFSDTTHPKSSADIEATLEFGPESTITAKYELVAIDDTIWLRPTNLVTNLDQATRASYQDLSQGDDVDSVIISLIGAGTLNQWEEFAYNPSLVTSYGLTYNLVRFGFSINSPLSGFPIVNTNKHHNTAVNLVMSSGMIQVDYKKIEAEKIDSKSYTVYNATFNAKTFVQTSRNLAELLNLSQRHRDAISEKDIKVEDGEFKLWIDPDTHLPHQLKAPRDGVEIIYSNFGDNFDIKPPL